MYITCKESPANSSVTFFFSHYCATWPPAHCQLNKFSKGSLVLYELNKNTISVTFWYSENKMQDKYILKVEKKLKCIRAFKALFGEVIIFKEVFSTFVQEM